MLESLADNLNGEYSGSPEVLVNGRKTGCFPDKTAFTNILGAQAAKVAPLYSDQSAYFRLTTRVTLGTTEFTLYSLLSARQRRQGDAAAAHVRNTLTPMPHTLLLRLPAPGQEDTEWLGIDEAGAPTTTKQRGPLNLAAAVARNGPGRRARIRDANSAGGAGAASRQRRQAGARGALRARRAAHRRHRSAVLRLRAAHRAAAGLRSRSYRAAYCRAGSRN